MSDDHHDHVSPHIYPVRYREHACGRIESDPITPRKSPPLPLQESKSPAEKRARRRNPRHELIRGSEVRKIRHRGRTGYAGDVPMTRLRGKVVSGDSCLEFDFALATDAQDDDIVNMIAQPFELQINLERRRTSWTPDFLIERRAGPRELVEVKPLAKIRSADPDKNAEARARLDACRVAAEEAGYLFRLVTEQEIRIEPMLYNARLIHRHNGPFADNALLLKAVLAFGTLGPCPTVSDLGAVVGQPSAAIELAIRLDRLGHLRLDRTRRIGRSTVFELVGASAEVKR